MDTSKAAIIIIGLWITINHLPLAPVLCDQSSANIFGVLRNRNIQPSSSRWLRRRTAPRLGLFHRQEPKPKPPKKDNTMVGTLLAAGLIQLLGRDQSSHYSSSIPYSVLRQFQQLQGLRMGGAPYKRYSLIAAPRSTPLLQAAAYRQLNKLSEKSSCCGSKFGKGNIELRTVRTDELLYDHHQRYADAMDGL